LSTVSTKIADGEHVTPRREPQGYYLLSARNVLDGRIDLEKVDYVGAEEYLRIRRRCDPIEGDVLISCSGTVGRVAIVPPGLECVMVRSAALIRPNPAHVDARFVQYYLQSEDGQRQIRNSLNQGAQANLFLGPIGALRLPLPPLPEQKAIGAVLSDVDALLDALDQLIAKKRDIKQAVMQQLLTGQTRIAGFGGTWERTTLGMLGRWFSGGTPSKTNETYWTGEIPWVSPKDMKVVRISDAIDHVGETAIGNGTRLLPAGAILVVVRGMILAHSAPVARVERPVAFNQDIKGLVVRSDVDSNFVLWWLLAHESLLLSLTNEATHGTKRMPTGELLKLQLCVPGLDEQSAVADVVSDMDAEITALRRRRDKTRLLKQGMMQELLTGRTRLV
jgi:type I restriction enzyme S subunit